MRRDKEALLDRLIFFAVDACRLTSAMRDNAEGAHIAGQLLRSATSPAANYAEACDAESGRDFIHKIKLCAKELRESWVWLRMAAELTKSPDITSVIRECNELIAIFVASLKTARKNSRFEPRNS
jgi:four helix bundle protein